MCKLATHVMYIMSYRQAGRHGIGSHAGIAGMPKHTDIQRNKKAVVSG